MKQLSTGTGLAILGVCAIAGMYLNRTPTAASAAASASAGPVAQIASAALAQSGPTIVWYGAVHNNRFAYTSNGCNNGTCDRSWEYSVLLRAWSDGTVEAKKICTGDSCGAGFSAGGWVRVASTTEGTSAFADLDLNSQVDFGDLAMMLMNFGPAPRDPVPPSNCPLDLINP